MKEEYLHFAFQRKLFGSEFQTTQGHELQVLDFGELNHDAGPDFLDARILFDGKVWVGPIEFHLKASDWFRHGHHNDPVYHNVLAHFVLENDKPVQINGFQIPAVELKARVNPEHYKKYARLLSAKKAILCAGLIKHVSTDAIELQKEKNLKQRLWKKSIKIVEDIEQHKGDRKKAFVLAVARTMGGKVNQNLFEHLAGGIDYNWLARLNYDPLRTDALIFGLSGLIPDQVKSGKPSNYIESLQTEYRYIQKLFDLKKKHYYVWKYARMRPFAFPDFRLALFSDFILHIPDVSGLLEPNWSVKSLDDLLKNELNPFWKSHFRLNGPKGDQHNARFSRALLDLIAINAVVPFVYAIGLWEGNESYKSNAIKILGQIKAEKNHITKQWEKAGVNVRTAFDSQSLLQLKKEGCNRKKCLFCAIGKNVLKT